MISSAKRMAAMSLLVAVKMLLVAVPSAASSESPGEIMRKAGLADHYSGDDRQSRVAMLIYYDPSQKPAKKIFRFLKRDLEEGGRQQFYVYFTQPTDIRRTALLVHKYVDRDDLRRLYLPASDSVLMISGKQKQCPFMGSDFSAEDFTGRHYAKDRHLLVEETELTVNAKKGPVVYGVWVIESFPRKFEEKTSKTKTWIDRKTYLPLRMEYYNHHKELYKLYEAHSIKEIGGYPTVTKRVMTSPLEGTRTILFLDEKNTRYDVGISASVFTEGSLKNPPQEVLQVE